MKKFWSALEYCTFGLIMQYENQLLSSRYYIYIYNSVFANICKTRYPEQGDGGER